MFGVTLLRKFPGILAVNRTAWISVRNQRDINAGDGSFVIHSQISNNFSSVPSAGCSSSPVCSHNEWDPLQEVIVGRLDGATVPQLLTELKGTIRKQEDYDFFQRHGGKSFPKEHLEKAEKEVEEFCRVLKSEGVIVRRPDVVDFSLEYRTPDFKTTGFHAAMPRDLLLVIGEEIIESPMAWRCRFFEYRAYRTLLKEYFKAGAKWTTPLKPLMCDELYDEVTNAFGIEWMRRHLEPKYKLHVLSFKDSNPIHIDTTINFLRPGLMMVHPERHCDQIDFFTKAGWQIVEAPQPTSPADHPSWFCSQWLSSNILLLDTERVIVEEQEEPTIRLFEKLGFTTIKLPMRFAYSFGGGFHCWTSDVRRTGTLESYF